MSDLDLGPVEVVVNNTRYVREATLFAAMERVDELTQQRDKLVQRLQADPDRAAIATIDGMMNIINDDTEAAGRVLDWVGVAADLPLAERVKWLAVRTAITQGYSFDDAERLADAALSGAAANQQEPS